MNCSSDTTQPAQQPLHPAPTCCACIVYQGRILLIQRAHEPNKGFWRFPGGHIELGETVFEAVKREVREETGVEIEPLEVFDVYDRIVRDDTGRVRFHYLVNYVRAHYLSGDPRAGDDAAQVRWVTETGIPDLTMHPIPRQTALRLLREAAQPPD